MMRPALFLDRDGVINQDIGYLHRAEDCRFIDGIFDLVAAANLAGHAVVVVTNQAGIARGYYSEAEFLAFSGWMLDRFGERGARIDRIYHCPHHPEAGQGPLGIACACRKPAPGMILSAATDLDLDLAASTLIGDSEKDLEAAAHAGVAHRYLLDPAAAPASLAATRRWQATLLRSLADVQSLG